MPKKKKYDFSYDTTPRNRFKPKIDASFSGEVRPVDANSQYSFDPVDAGSSFNAKPSIDAGFSGEIGLSKEGRPAKSNSQNAFLLDSNLTMEERIALQNIKTGNPTIGGRELSPIHVHIMAENKHEWEKGRGMVDMARKLAGMAYTLRPDVLSTGVQRTYPDQSRIKIYSNAGVIVAMIYPTSKFRDFPKEEKKPEYEWDYEKASNEFLLIGVRRPQGFGWNNDGSPSFFEPYQVNVATSIYEGYASLKYDATGTRMYVYEPGAPGVGEDGQPRMIVANLNNSLDEDRSPRDAWKVGRQRKFIDRFWTGRGGYLENRSGFGYWESLAGSRFNTKTIVGPCYTSDNFPWSWDAYIYNYHPDAINNYPENVGTFNDVRPTVFHYPLMLTNKKYYDQIFVADPNEGRANVAVPLPEWRPPYPPYIGTPPDPIAANPYSRSEPKVYEPGNVLLPQPAGYTNPDFDIEDWPNGWEQEFRPSEPFLDGEYKALYNASGLPVEFLVVIGTGHRQVTFEFITPSGTDWTGIAANVNTKTARLLTAAETGPFDADSLKIGYDMGTEFLWGPYA